ncbi:MAG: hypothetical protein WD054_04650 [Gemmatimonadota bacterium]
MQVTDQTLLLAAALLVAAAMPAAAQHDLRLGAHAVPLLTHISPILSGRAETEAYLTQPALMAEALLYGGRLNTRATISLEPLTLDRGELGAGTHGEGYVDRRHPHTYLHELMLTASGGSGAVHASLSAGRGFAPFGTDDPMMRPFAKFPANHHLAQVLERLTVIGAVRANRAVLELGVFNGTEPFATTEPFGASGRASFSRFGDSGSARVTLLPIEGLELQASGAWVASPEMPRGEGSDHRKWSASGRYEHEHEWGTVYALAEWSHTAEIPDGGAAAGYDGLLAELEVATGGWRPALRIERTERPEQARGFDPFRTPWPHADTHTLGVTRWTIVGARLERRATWRGLGAAPFLEASRSHVREIAGGAFDPAAFYGDTRIWTISIGARLTAGTHAARMGRYGVALPARPAANAHAH